MYRLNVQVTANGRQIVPDRGVVRSCDPLQNFLGSSHVTGTAEHKVVKFCTRGYANSDNRTTYHQQKGRCYGDVTVLKFCRLSWCSALRGFVSDSWATCFKYCSQTVTTTTRTFSHRCTRKPPEAECNLKTKFVILRSGFDYLYFWCFQIFRPFLPVPLMQRHIQWAVKRIYWSHFVGGGAICGICGLSPSSLPLCARPWNLQWRCVWSHSVGGSFIPLT